LSKKSYMTFFGIENVGYSSSVICDQTAV